MARELRRELIYFPFSECCDEGRAREEWHMYWRLTPFIMPQLNKHFVLPAQWCNAVPALTALWCIAVPALTALLCIKAPPPLTALWCIKAPPPLTALWCIAVPALTSQWCIKVPAVHSVYEYTFWSSGPQRYTKWFLLQAVLHWEDERRL